MKCIVQPSVNYEDLNKVWSLTYWGGKPIEIKPDVVRHDVSFEARIDGRIVGAFSVLPITASRGATELQCAGVAGVAVMPHERQHGVGSEMMRFGIRHYRELGYETAALYAFRETFYRKFGYEVAGLGYTIKVDTGRFPKAKLSLEPRLLSPKDVDQIKACYEQFAFKRSGLNLRRHAQWDRIVPPDSNKTIYAVGNPVEAYAIVQHDPEFWVEQKIQELVWTTRRGYDSILSVISGIGINKTHLSWVEPSDSPYRAIYWDRGAEISRAGGHACWRVLHVPNALKKLKTPHTGHFTIEVIDEDFAENLGPWRVEFSPKGVEVSKNSEAGIRMNIRQFSQAFMGDPSLRDLANNDLIEVLNPSDLIQAELLLPHSPTLCLDFY